MIYTIILISLSWITLGILSSLWQQQLYKKQFGQGASGIPLGIHVALGPIALIFTFIIDYLKLGE
jgi:hypothetical protein